MSRADLEKISDLYQAYFAEMRALIARLQPVSAWCWRARSCLSYAAPHRLTFGRMRRAELVDPSGLVDRGQLSSTY